MEAEIPDVQTIAGRTFENGVLTTPDMKLSITDYRVIPVGAEGNEYGNTPLLAIWYDTTHLGTPDREVSPLAAFIVNFMAYQDNDPNIVNKLSMGALPDDTYFDTQSATLKPGGTIANAVSYQLTDTTTPVDLVAIHPLGEVGRMTFTLN